MSIQHNMTTLLTSTMLTLTTTTTHHYNNNNDDNNISIADSVDYGTTFILDDSTNDTTDNSSLSNMTGYYPEPGIIIQVLARFHLIALPTIAVLGIISNILSFCIFISKTLRRTSCSIYLAARSVSDTGFLLSLFISWLGDAMSVPVVHTIVVCQLVVFSSYVFGFLSVWLVVFITLENYIRICHPFSVSTFCTVQKARHVLLALVILSLAIYQFPLWTTHVADLGGQQRCGNKPEFINIAQVMVYVDMVITLAIPSVVIIFFMIAISISLVRSLKRQSRLKGSKPTPTLNNHALTTQATNGGAGEGAHANNSNSWVKKSAKKASRKGSSPQAKVTKLLFAVSCTFLVLSLPSHIVRLRVMMLVMAEQSSMTPSLDQMMQVVFQILYYLSFAVNLMVYLSCGESFRNVFIETYVSCILGKGMGRRRSEISHTTYTAVKMETTPENPEKKEEETSLIN